MKSQMGASWDKTWSSSLADKFSQAWDWIRGEEKSGMNYFNNVSGGSDKKLTETAASFTGAKVVKVTSGSNVTFGLQFEDNANDA